MNLEENKWQTQSILQLQLAMIPVTKLQLIMEDFIILSMQLTLFHLYGFNDCDYEIFIHAQKYQKVGAKALAVRHCTERDLNLLVNVAQMCGVLETVGRYFGWQT